MLKSIKDINITEKFYNEFINLVKSFRNTNINYNQFINYINELSTFHDIFLLIDEESENIIGCVTVLLEQKIIHDLQFVCHIEDLIINNIYKNKGFGSIILDYIKKYVREKKCYKIILNCDCNIKEFYIKNNFTSKNIEMSYYF